MIHNIISKHLENLPFSVGADDIALNSNFQSYSDPYIITVTDENGCESESEIFLIEPPKLNLFLTQPTQPAYCSNNLLGSNTGWAQVSASGGTPDQNDSYNFVWSVNGQADEDVLYSSIENMNSGYYDVTVVDSRLCAEQLTVFIDLEPTWQEYSSTIDASCFGSPTGTVSISMEGGCGDEENSCNFYYEWNGGAATGNNLPTVNGLQQGNYSVTVTDDFGCEGVYTLTVNGPTRVDFQLTDLINQTCYTPTSSSDDGSVTVDITGGSAPYNVTWSDINSISSSAITNDELIITGLTAGEWLIEVEDANSCVGVFDLSSLHPNPFTIENGVEVTAEIDPQQFLLTDVIDCYGESNGEASVLNPNPNFVYSWYLENSNDLIDIGPSTSSLPAGNIVVAASYELGLCEVTSSSVTIDQNSPFVIINNSSDPLCNNDVNGNINISISGASPFLNQDQIADYNYNWFPSILNTNAPTIDDGSLDFNITNLDDGQYFIEVVDRYDCVSVFEIILENPLPIYNNITHINPDCHFSNGNSSGEIQIISSGVQLRS